MSFEDMPLFADQPVRDLSPFTEEPPFGLAGGFEVACVTPEEEFPLVLANSAGVKVGQIGSDPSLALLARQKYLASFGEGATLRSFDVRSKDPEYPDPLAGSYVAVIAPRLGMIAVQ